MDSFDDGERVGASSWLDYHTSHEVARISKADMMRLKLMEALTHVILSHPQVNVLIRELIPRVQDIMQVDNVAILRLDSSGLELIMDTVRGPEEAVAERIHIPVESGVAGSIVVSKQPLIIDDLSQAQVVHSFLREHLKSLAGVPLLVEGDRVVGVLHVSTIQPRHFTTDDIQLLQIVADRIALAIDHAQMLEAEHRARAFAEAVTKKLEAMQAINEILLRHLGVDDLITALLARISQVMQVDNVAILLPTPDHRDLVLHSVFGPEQVVASTLHVPIGQGIAGTIMATGQALIIPDLATSNAVNPFLREHLRSLYGVPLQVDNQVIGVLHISTLAPRVFTEEDGELLRIVADRIAAAIARAQAFDEAGKARAEAESRARELAQLNERMDNFLSIASHEMRTPLTSVIANLDILTRRLARMRALDDPPTFDQTIADIAPLAQRARKQSARLNGLVGDLLDMSRIQADRLDIRVIHTDLREVVREAVEEQRQAVPEREIRLLEPAREVALTCDPDRIGQVVTNYLTNALKFAPPEYPLLVTVTHTENVAKVAVTDHGPGISSADQARIWDRFQRVEAIEHQSGSYIGLGLGLFICKTIIERHRGEIGVTSQVGQGSTFWFTLPLEV